MLVAKPKEDKKDKKCPICGGAIISDTGKCSVCGGSATAKQKRGKKVQISLGGKGGAKVKPIVDSGENSASEKKPQKKSADDETLASWLSGDDNDGDLNAWMKNGDETEGKPPEPKNKAKPKPKDEGQDALRKWLSG